MSKVPVTKLKIKMAAATAITTKMLMIISLMPIVNLFFVISAGLLYKKFLSNEKYTILLFLSIAVIFSSLMWQARTAVLALNILFFFVLMASLYTTNNQMMSFIPFGFKKSGRVSAAAGILDSSFYLGAAIAGPIIGAAADNFGWNGIFGGILGICLLAVLVSVIRYLSSTSVLPKPPSSGREK